MTERDFMSPTVARLDARYARKHGRPLSDDELAALRWARTNYRDWRKHFSETREEHSARYDPKAFYGFIDHLKREVWESWYDAPFGEPRWNQYVQTVRRLLAEGL